MRKLQSIAAVTLFATAWSAGAQEAISSHVDAQSSAVRLTDSELDQIVAGRVISILIAPPNDNGIKLIQHTQGNGPTIVIIGAGKGQDVFGTIVTDNHGIKTIPGRN